MGENQVILHCYTRPVWKLVFFSEKLFSSHCQLFSPWQQHRKLPFSPSPAHKCRQFVAGTHLQESAGFIEAKCPVFHLDTWKPSGALTVCKINYTEIFKHKHRTKQNAFNVLCLNTDANITSSVINVSFSLSCSLYYS